MFLELIKAYYAFTFSLKFLSTIAISLLGSWLLSMTNVSNSIIILGIIATAIMVLLLYYMKDKVGLKVDNYSDEDLKYSHVIK